MADDRVIQIAVSPGTQEFPDEVYLLYQSGAVFHGSLSDEGWKWNEVSLPQGKAFHPTGAACDVVGIWGGAFSGHMKVSVQAARSIG